MKTITMDFKTYEDEIQKAKLEGVALRASIADQIKDAIGVFRCAKLSMSWRGNETN